MDKIMMAIKGLELPLNKKNDLVNAIKKYGANSVSNGVIIVDSVNKLDPDAEVGSIACVATAGSIQEKSFKDLYQPDASIIDQTAGAFTQPELLSSVSCINFLTPTDYSGVNTLIYLAPRTFSQTDMRMMYLGISYSNGVLSSIAGYYTNQTSGEEATYIVGQVVDGVYTIDNATVIAINNILASDDWCYLGYEIFDGAPITKEQFATLDKFAMVVAGVPSITDIYVKGDKWELLNGKDLDNLKSSIDKNTKALDDKSDLIKIKDVGPSGAKLEPNTYYTCTIDNSYSHSSPTFYLLFPEDNTKYVEHIIQINYKRNDERTIKFIDYNTNQELSIIWANGSAPIYQYGCTYIISISNSFGVYSMFPNS